MIKPIQTRWGMKRLRRELHRLGFKTFGNNKLSNPDEVFIQIRYGGQNIEGIAGRPNAYPDCRPHEHYYLILCHDWDRRANAWERRFFQPETMHQVFDAVLERLKLGYEGDRQEGDF